ncbi:type II secretion system F family protein [Actinomycetota bacterium]
MPAPSHAGLVVAVLVALAVLAWPSRRHAAAGQRDPEHTGLDTPPGPDPAGTPAEVADALVLLALALRSGIGPVEALEHVAGSCDGAVRTHLESVAAAHRWGLDPSAAWEFAPPVWRPAALAWRIALTAGAAPADLVERAATEVRDRESRRVEAAVGRAGVLLVLPLGLAFLPAFGLTTVVPVVLALARGALAG